MNRRPAMPLCLLPVMLGLLSAGLFSACEKSQDSREGIAYSEENAFTLDPTPGTTRAATTNAVLSVAPDTASVSGAGDTLVFTASGGVPPYEWGVGNSTIGIIQVRNGNPCVYVCKQLKQNSVFVTDREGNVAVANIASADKP